jgi:hypothetical protein
MLFLRLPAPGHALLVEEIGGELVARKEGGRPAEQLTSSRNAHNPGLLFFTGAPLRQ